jgi:hypothetical protein
MGATTGMIAIIDIVIIATGITTTTMTGIGIMTETGAMTVKTGARRR